MICNPLLQNCQQVENPQTYIGNVIQVILSIFLIIGVLYFIWHFVYGGFHLMESEGDPKKLEEARTEVTNAFVGLAIVFSVFAVLKVAGTVLGIPDLQNLRLPLPSL